MSDNNAAKDSQLNESGATKDSVSRRSLLRMIGTLAGSTATVSYTHLTLPTILRV